MDKASAFKRGGGPLTAARSLYRKLPIGWRTRFGRALWAFAEPALASGLPSASGREEQPVQSAAILGLFRTPLGHAAAARLLAREIQCSGLQAACVDVSGALGAPIEAPLLEADTDPYTCEAVILALNPDSAIVALSQMKPQIIRDKRTIGYWVWELERAPARWRHGARLVDEIWAPSTFAAAAIEERLRRSVKVVPHPVALSKPHPASASREKLRAGLGLAQDDFVALMSFSMTSSMARKNPMAAMRAFRDAFADHPRARLFLRCLNGMRYPDELGQLRAACRAQGSQVQLIEAAGGLDELADLYALADAYVSLHRSEGFGLNLAEAMQAGLPVVATGWSGNLDFMSSANSILVPVKSLIPVEDTQRIYVEREAVWAEPDHDAAVAALRALESDPQLRARLGAAARQGVNETLSGGAAVRSLRLQD